MEYILFKINFLINPYIKIEEINLKKNFLWLEININFYISECVKKLKTKKHKNKKLFLNFEKKLIIYSNKSLLEKDNKKLIETKNYKKIDNKSIFKVFKSLKNKIKIYDAKLIVILKNLKQACLIIIKNIKIKKIYLFTDN